MRNKKLILLILLVVPLSMILSNQSFAQSAFSANEEIVVNKSSITITEGQWDACKLEITIFNSKYKKLLDCTVKNNKIASTYGVEWHGKQAIIHIDGLRAGETKLIIKLKGTDEKVTIPIKVKPAKWLDWDYMLFAYPKVKFSFKSNGVELRRGNKKVFIKDIKNYKKGKVYKSNGVRYKYTKVKDLDAVIWYNRSDLVKKGILNK